MAKTEKGAIAQKATVRAWGDVSPEVYRELKIEAIRAGVKVGKHVGEILARHVKGAKS